MRKTTFATILSLVLFLGGIGLLALRVPFWSLFLGLPATQIGIIFIILAFDQLSQNEVEQEMAEIRQIPCSLCGQPMFVREGETKGICNQCDQKILEKMGKVKPS